MQRSEPGICILKEEEWRSKFQTLLVVLLLSNNRRINIADRTTAGGVRHETTREALRPTSHCDSLSDSFTYPSRR